jgi:hypothetical protein
MTTVDDRLDDLNAMRDGKSWTWHWRSPWSTTVVSERSYKTRAAALAAGRAFVKANR